MSESVDLFGNYGGTLQATLRAAAAAGPMAWDTTTGAAVVFRHHDVAAFARDPRLRGIGLSLFDLMGITDGPLRDWYGRLMFTTEGPVHRRLRSLVARAFTPRAAESLRRTAADLAAAVRHTPRPDGHEDLVERFALLPTRVMCRLLGVPHSDVATFAAWLDDLAPVFVMMTPDQITTATQAIIELLAYLDDLTTTRRCHPGPDLITALLAAEDAGDRLTHDEVVAMVANLLVAGQDTTISQLGCGLFVLLTDPRQAAWATARTTPLGHVVSETVRLEPAIPALPRTTTETLRIDDHEIPAGAVVLLCSATANRDPAVWHNPERFDADRFAHSDTPQLMTFGAGSHYCLGSALARVTLEECLRAILVVHGQLTLVEPSAEIPWRSAVGRSPERLLVTTPAH